MELNEKSEEILEELWIRIEESKEGAVLLDTLDVNNGDPMTQLLDGRYISVTGGKVTLTEEGRPIARNVVRRHRLAERLLVDVLGAGEDIMHERACKFEHILDQGLDESICNLLGHPKICPHGEKIPPGRCCKRKRKQRQGVVDVLSHLTPGQNGKVAYIYANDQDRLQKLTTMGILPGAPIQLIQSFPSYFFQVRQTQFAVDQDIADSIYVRLIENKYSEQEEGEEPKYHNWRAGKLAQLLGITRL